MQERPIAFMTLMAFCFLAALAGGMDWFSTDLPELIGSYFGLFIFTWVVWLIGRAVVRSITGGKASPAVRKQRQVKNWKVPK